MNRLPESCEECRPYGGSFCIVEGRGAERCGCPRGIELARQDAIRKAEPDSTRPFKPRISLKAASQAAQAFLAMGDAPRAEAAVTMIADELLRLCNNTDDARWIVRRMLHLYSRWPGTREMRLVFCASRLPCDGVALQGISEGYPEGFPSEQKHPEIPRLTLPAGHVVTMDRQLDGAFQDAASKVKTLPKPKRVIGS